MFRQRQPNNQTCLITSFAMILDMDVEELILRSHHDKSHHIQEIIDLCMKEGYSVTEIEAIPTIFPDTRYLNEEQCRFRITEYLNKYSGILTGVIPKNNKRHAVAWNHEACLIFDPNGTVYEFTKDCFAIESFWIVGGGNHVTEKEI